MLHLNDGDDATDAAVIPTKNPKPKRRRGPNVRIAPPPDAFSYRLKDAAARLGVGERVLHNLISAGKLHAIKIGGLVVVPRAEMDRLSTQGTKA